jgi:hypothetical protein
MLDAISRQLLGMGSSQNKVTLEAGVDYLYNDVFVGEADDKPVFWSITNSVRRQYKQT